MEKELPKRKPHRLPNHKYDACGIYFLTICTAERRNYFWKNEIAVNDSQKPSPCFQNIELSAQGIIVNEAINNISKIYSSVSVEHYVIMPDHIHLLLLIRADEYGRLMVAPTISRIVQQMKGYATKRIGFPVWQKLFYDHIIRDKKDYEEHVKYIYDNPMKLHYE